MPTRFAVKTGLWSDTTVWDNGALPTSSDTVHANGFVITLDQDITIDGFNNQIPTVAIQNIATPKMLSNTSPSGAAISSNSSGTAYYAFNQDMINGALSPLSWTGSSQVSWIGYTFSTSKVIKRYIIRQNSASGGQNAYPKTWTFEGSNDGFATAGVQLDQVLSFTTNGPYTSVLLANTTAYTSYRLNITATFGGSTVAVGELEMTESTVATPVYGTTTGGSFTVPASLSGTRNIVQNGEGIKTNNSTIISIAATAGATVNFNIVSGGYIFNQTGQRVTNASSPLISITGNCAVNFNTNLWGWQTPSSYYITNGNVGILAAATVTVNGNIYGSKGGTNATNFDSVISVTNANAILNVNGDVYGGTQNAFGQAIISRAINTINITGNVYGDAAAAVYTDSSPTINITGTVNLMGINSTAAISAYYWAGAITPLVTVNGYIVNKNNTNAIAAAKIRFTANTNPYWVFQNSAAADITLAYGAATGSYPAEADVKLGVAYAASPTRYGTCAVPLPQYVSQGVATGSTIGTAYLNAADVWNILTSTITTSGSIGERLKNASTVQTTGDQIASYQV